MIEQFPEDTPPDGAKSMQGAFYRLASKHLKPGERTDDASWLRPYQTRKNRYHKHPEDPEAHGLSIFADLDDLRRCRQINAPMRRKSVAEVTIGFADGDLRHTPIENGITHHDWWTAPYNLVPDAEIVEAGEEATDGV